MRAETFVENVDWQPKPVQRAARAVRLIRVKPYKPVYGWIVSKQVTRILVHWDGADSWPHMKDKSKCPGCRQGMPLRQKGYLLILLESSPKLYVVELTPGCMQDDICLNSDTIPLRGKFVTLKKTPSRKTGREHPKSPQEAVWGPSLKQPPRCLPADFDIRPTLGLIFGYIPNIHGEVRGPELAQGVEGEGRS